MTRNARPRSPYARLGLSSQASAKDAERAHRELVGFLEGAPEGLRRWAKGEIAVADEAYAVISNPTAARRARRGSPRRRAAIAIGALAATVAVVIGVYDMGGQDKASSQSGATAESGLSPGDEARVGQLMEKLKTAPKDVKTLVALGNIFFEAQNYNEAGGWMKRALALEPDNVKARMALGASEFNLGDSADARHDWQRVIDAEPRNVEAYYDLGFLYVSKEPPDMDGAREMWGKVVELAPNSDVAKTVSTHLEGLEKAEAGSASGSEG